MTGTTSLGTLVVYLAANATQYQRALKQVDVSTGMHMESAVRAAKYGAVAIAGSMTIISAAAIREFAKFDKAMTMSLAIMGDVSDETRKQMEGVARDIAKSSSTSADKVAESYHYLASAGFDVAQSMAALPIVEKFAVAGMFDMNRATTLLADSQSALGLRSENAAENMRGLTRVADVLTKANIMANASVEDFAEALTTKSANALRLVNKEVEEGVAVLAAFAQQGIKAEAAGDALHQVIRDLQRASIKNREDWDDFGLSIFDASGKMRHLADIVEQLETALGPMNDEQRRTTLMLLGFQDRSISATQALLGLSGQIRKYEAGMKSAGGLTEEVAQKQLKSLNAQFSIFINNIKDGLITLGQDLISVLQALGFSFGNTTANLATLNSLLKGGALTLAEYNAKVKEVTEEQRKWEETSRKVRDTIVALSLTAMTTFMDVVYGWKLIVTAAQWALAAYKTAVSGTMLLAAKMVEANIKLMVAGVNKAIALYNVAKVLMGDLSKPVKPITFTGFEVTKELETDTKKAAVGLAQLTLALDKLIADGRPSDEFLARWEALQHRMNFGPEKTELEKITKALNAFFGSMDKAQVMGQAVDDALKEFFHNMDTGADAIALFTPELKNLRDLLADPLTSTYDDAIKGLDIAMRQSIDAVKKMDDALAAGTITQEQYDERTKHNVISTQQYNDALQKLLATQNQFIKPLGGLSTGPLKDQTGDPTIDQFVDNHNEMSLLEKAFEDKLAATDAYYDRQIKAQEGNAAEQMRLEQVRINTLKQMEETYLANQGVLARKRQEMILQTSAAMFGELATIAETAFGKQSGMYKAAFVASKAFAIADATMKMYQAGMQVMADATLPFYAKIPAYLAIIGHGISIISNMQSVALSFEGGGHTGHGPRTGGLDGKGGYMAMIHPQERIIDEYQGQKYSPEKRITKTFLEQQQQGTTAPSQSTVTLFAVLEQQGQAVSQFNDYTKKGAQQTRTANVLGNSRGEMATLVREQNNVIGTFAKQEQMVATAPFNALEQGTRQTYNEYRSFEGGGDTGNGPRTGGLDGKGGFMAMLHPQEDVVDRHNKDSEEADDQGNVYVEINQTFTGGVTQTDLARASEETERRAFNAVTEAISRGGSYRKAVRR